MLYPQLQSSEATHQQIVSKPYGLYWSFTTQLVEIPSGQMFEREPSVH